METKKYYISVCLDESNRFFRGSDKVRTEITKKAKNIFENCIKFKLPILIGMTLLLGVDYDGVFELTYTRISIDEQDESFDLEYEFIINEK